jgi:hypothetical protein
MSTMPGSFGLSWKAKLILFAFALALAGLGAWSFTLAHGTADRRAVSAATERKTDPADTQEETQRILTKSINGHLAYIRAGLDALVKNQQQAKAPSASLRGVGK